MTTTKRQYHIVTTVDTNSKLHSSTKTEKRKRELIRDREVT